MMDKKILALVFILLLAGTGFAQLSDFFEGVSQDIEQEKEPFIRATQTATGTVPQAFREVWGAFDPGYCGPDQVPDIRNMSWIGLTLAAVIVVSFGIALIYMLGELMQSPNLIAVSKEEAFQVLMTVVRVAFIGLVLFSLNQYYAIKSSGMTDPVYTLKSSDPNNQGNPLTVIDASMAFCRLLISEMVTTYSNLVMYNMVIHTMYSSTMWFGVTWRAMYSFNLGPVLKPLIDIIGMALQYLSLGIGEWMLHLVLLCMIKKWTWTLFIPLGIFLRSIPQTRGAGEALFAIIFALAVIYPFMFLVTYETHKLLENNLAEGGSMLRNFVQKSGILTVAVSVIVAMFLTAGVFFPFFVGMALNIAFELVRNAVYYVIIMSLLLPFLNIFITLTAAKEIARFFSVDVSFMSFIKIV